MAASGLARFHCRLDVHVVGTRAQVRGRRGAACADQRDAEKACRSNTRLTQVWASREAPAGATRHGVAKSIAPRSVGPELQMGSSHTKRGRIRQEYVGTVRPLIIERDTLVLSPHM